MVDRLTFRFIRSLTINFELLFDCIQQRLFGRVVLCAKLVGAFKHEMFEIMGKSRRFCRVILPAHSYCDKCLYARSFLVYGEVNL